MCTIQPGELDTDNDSGTQGFRFPDMNVEVKKNIVSLRSNIVEQIYAVNSIS